MFFVIKLFSYWKNKFPHRGWLYLSVEYLCFYSYMMGLINKIVVRWTDVVNLEKNNSVLSSTIKVTTRDKREVSIYFVFVCLQSNISHLYSYIFYCYF